MTIAARPFDLSDHQRSIIIQLKILTRERARAHDLGDVSCSRHLLGLFANLSAGFLFAMAFVEAPGVSFGSVGTSVVNILKLLHSS